MERRQEKMLAKRRISARENRTKAAGFQPQRRANVSRVGTKTCLELYPKLGSLEHPQKFRNQDFERLRNYYLKKNEKFIDESFPANKKSLGWHLEDKFNDVKWKRASEICKDPHLIVDGISLFDIVQNEIGNCWVLATMGSTALRPKILENILPVDQDFNKDYAGIFHFRLWHLGDWYDVVIDDLLPFLNGKCISVQPSCKNEFWPCLLEKAYAKLLGSYEALHGGDPANAFMSFTGGITVTFNLSDPEAITYWNMIRSASQDTLMACATDSEANEEKNIVSGHAYSITGHAEVPFMGESVKLIQLRNPWGHTEWKGDWSDRSSLWKKLRKEDRVRLQKIREDGQFWMSWEDFIKRFSDFYICNQVPDFLDWEDENKRWSRIMFRGRWAKVNLSWNVEDEDFFIKNPLYTITVNESNEVKSGINVVISILQNSRNRKKFGEWLPVGFKLFEISESLEEISLYTSYNLEAFEKFGLRPGRYGIIPFTAQGEHESSFLLQVFLKNFPESCEHEANSFPED